MSKHIDKYVLHDKLKDIKVIVSDVDGVLTDGFIFTDQNYYEPLNKFSIYDGMAITMANDCGLGVIIISGRKSLCTEARFSKLGITEVHTGVADKKAYLLDLSKRLNLDLSEMLYIGDDLIDLGAMSLVGVKVAPKNAVYTVQQFADYVTLASGGRGVLREIVDLILKAQDKYDSYIQKYF